MWWGSPALNLRTVIKSVWKLEKGNWVILRRLDLKPQLLVSHVPNSLERGQTSGWKDRLIIVRPTYYCTPNRVGWSGLFNRCVCVLHHFFFLSPFSDNPHQMRKQCYLKFVTQEQLLPTDNTITYGLLLRTNSDMTVYCSSGLCTLYT